MHPDLEGRGGVHVPDHLGGGIGPLRVFVLILRFARQPGVMQGRGVQGQALLVDQALQVRVADVARLRLQFPPVRACLPVEGVAGREERTG